MKNSQRNELAICGLEPVRAVARVRPGDVLRFFYTEDRSRDFGTLCSMLAKSRRPYRMVGADELERLSGTVHHQGVVAMVADTPLQPVTDALVASWSGACSRIVVLDGVGDDHNIGSIARSAAFFGWTAMVVTGTAVRLTTSAYRVARGALEHIPVYSDASAEAFIRRCGTGIVTVGADHRGMEPLGALKELQGALALVLGNEETGLSPGAVRACSRLVQVKGSGAVESLNVSQAAAVFLYGLS